MKSIEPLRPFILAFVVALIGYAIFYYAIEHWRNRNGPWQVTFTNDLAGAPVLVINQPRLGIANVRITFAGESLPATNASATLVFDRLRPVPYAVPFGKCIFMDSSSLPGTVTLEVFSHQIQLLPRVLTIDRQEHSWVPGDDIRLRVGPDLPGR